MPRMSSPLLVVVRQRHNLAATTAAMCANNINFRSSPDTFGVRMTHLERVLILHECRVVPTALSCFCLYHVCSECCYSTAHTQCELQSSSVAGYNCEEQSAFHHSPPNRVYCQDKANIPLASFDLAGMSHLLIYNFYLFSVLLHSSCGCYSYSCAVYHARVCNGFSLNRLLHAAERLLSIPQLSSTQMASLTNHNPLICPLPPSADGLALEVLQGNFQTHMIV